MLSDHPNDCLTCPKCSDCELQRLVMRFNIRQMPFTGGEQSTRKKEITAAITRNMDKCILCRRCETVCNQVQTVGVLGAVRRGFETTIAPTFDRMFKDTDCDHLLVPGRVQFLKGLEAPRIACLQAELLARLRV